MRMELQEKYMWPLTSPTTCYSGARSVIPRRQDGGEEDGSPVTTASLATALHEIHVHGLDSAEPSVRWEPVDANGHYICVGYASDTDYTITDLLAGLEGFVHAGSSSHEDTLDTETAQMLRDSIYANASETATTATDTASITAQSVLSDATSIQPQQARRTSSSEFDMFSSGGGDNWTATADSSQQAPQSNHTEHRARLPTALRGRLVWKETRHPTIIRATCEIDFRPLAMTFGRVWVRETTTGDVVKERPVVWMGSADAARLYAFYWVEETSQLHPLSLDSDDEVFDVTSPVMAMDVRQEDESNCNYLAIACQDGTVRCIRFSQYDATTHTWVSPKEVSQLIVDGPLVCLQFVPGTTRALVGSLCGYVMSLDYYNDSHHPNGGGSPSLVASELEFDDGAEDSVLAVHGWDDWVAVGTQTGALLLYRRCATVGARTSNHYRRAGKWRLPYSVHEICHVGEHNPHHGGLLVTTRKSLHCFKLYESSPSLDVALALSRIQHLRVRLSNSYWAGTPTQPDAATAVAGETKEGHDEVSPEVLHDEKE